MRLGAVERATLLSDEEEAVLRFIVRMMDERELVPLSLVRSSFGLRERESLEVTDRLYRLRLVSKDILLGEPAFRPTFAGLDALAIRDLIGRKVVKSISAVIGEGKESSVYLGYSPDDTPLAIKFLRVGRSSYKNARKLRGYREKVSWIRVSIDSAKNEFETLKCVKENYGYVPEPKGHSYNAVAMEFVEGQKLLYAEPENPKEVLDSILATERVSYLFCGKAHGDLSEYNVLVNGNTPYVIDWPQADRDEDLLRRDVYNIAYYFFKKYGIEIDIDAVMKYVKGEA